MLRIPKIELQNLPVFVRVSNIQLICLTKTYSFINLNLNSFRRVRKWPRTSTLSYIYWKVAAFSVMDGLTRWYKSNFLTDPDNLIPPYFSVYIYQRGEKLIEGVGGNFVFKYDGWPTSFAWDRCWYYATGRQRSKYEI